MLNVQEIIGKIKKNDLVGLSEENIADFENYINWKLPKDYREIIKSVEGGYGEIGKYYIEFWDLDDMCFYYEDMKDLDGLIPFASDGCGVAFAFDIKTDAIFSVHMDCLERSYANKISMNFSDFVDKLISQDLQY